MCMIYIHVFLKDYYFLIRVARSFPRDKLWFSNVNYGVGYRCLRHNIEQRTEPDSGQLILPQR